MGIRFKRFFTWLLHIPNIGPEETHRQLLNILLLTMTASSLLLIMFSIFARNHYSIQDLANLKLVSGLAFGISLALNWLNRNTSGWLSSVLFCGMLWGICLLADSPDGIYGVHSTLKFALPMIAACVLICWWSGFIFAGFSSLAIAVMALSNGQLPSFPEMLILFLLALIAGLAARNTEQTIRSLRQSNRSLQASQERFQQLNEEHLRSQEALRASEERYRFLAENMADVVWLLDLQTQKFIYVSPSVERLRGYTMDEVLAQPMDAVLTAESLSIIHNILPQRISAYLAGDQEAVLQIHQVEQPCKDGSTVWTEVVSTVFGSAESGLQMLGVSRNITDRRQIEQARRQAESAAQHRAEQLMMINEIVKQMASTLDLHNVLVRATRLIHDKFNYHHVGVFLLDQENNTLVMRARSGSFDHLFPLEHHIPLGQGMVGWVGQHGETLLAGDVGADERYVNFYPDRLPTRSELDVPIRSGDEILGVLDVQSPELGAFTSDDVLVIETLADELAVAIQNARLYDSLLQELIERKRAEAHVRQLTEELEQRVIERTAQLEATNKELETFAYSVSHDLRAPLRAIHGFSRMLADDYAELIDAHGQGLLRRVQDASQRMGELIDDLLKLSRLTRSQMRLMPVNISHLAREIASELSQEDPTRQVAWIIADDLHAQADAGLLRAVLENLLSNAWKFTGQNPQACIEVGCTRYENGERVFFVRDNGVGFDMAYVDKLFGAFQRLHLPEEFPGTGIGLATVQRVIHRHGGKVWPEATPGKGATFYFTLGEGKG